MALPVAVLAVNAAKNLTFYRGVRRMKTVTTNSQKPKFDLGQIVATPGALEAVEASGQCAAFFVNRHARGDWGDVGQEDWRLNDLALQDGSRILSAYKTLKGVKLWVITEATDDAGHRAATTLLLPDEY